MTTRKPDLIRAIKRGPKEPHVTTEPLVRAVVYMYPKQRQALREKAARHGMSVSAYLLYLAGV